MKEIIYPTVKALTHNEVSERQRKTQTHNTVTTVLTEQRGQHCTEEIPRGHNKEVKKVLIQAGGVCVCGGGAM